MKLIHLFFSLIFLILLSCTKTTSQKSGLFSKGVSAGEVSKKLEEASGLAASIVNPGFFWVINDSGNAAEVYLINDKADVVLTCKLEGIKNRDWEDIAISKHPDSTRSYIYVAEVGDNDAEYDCKYLYRFIEPALEDDKKISISEVETLVITLPDGARDMESITIHQLNGDLYLISKREENVFVYQVHSPQLTPGDTIIPRKVTTLPYHNVVASDISFDGKEILIKTYDEIYYWNTGDSLDVARTLSRPATVLEYTPEPQGESIAWTLDGRGFYTLSESVDDEQARLYYYKRN